MEAYSSFAQVYDLFMDNIPYDEWSEQIVSLLRKYDIADGIVADLGCGTGQITRRLSAAGYDMIGIDASPEMLDIAYRKDPPGSGILYLEQDLTEMELYGTVRACVCVCDTLNYLLSPEDLLRFFRLVNNYLDPGGIFLFDCNTPRFYKEIGSSTIAENRDDASFIWENEYDPDSCLNEYRMTFYVRDEEDTENERYRRSEEIHTHRAYTEEELTQILAEAGLLLLEVFDADTGLAPDKETLRLYFVTREQGK